MQLAAVSCSVLVQQNCITTPSDGDKGADTFFTVLKQSRSIQQIQLVMYTWDFQGSFTYSTSELRIPPKPLDFDGNLAVQQCMSNLRGIKLSN